MNGVVWSSWFPVGPSSSSIVVPDSAGTYEVRTDYEFGRLRGRSTLIYVGSTGNLKRRFLDQRFVDPERYLSRTEKLLLKGGHVVELRYATTSDIATARRLEAERLSDYEQKHWELPPGNGVLPRGK